MYTKPRILDVTKDIDPIRTISKASAIYKKMLYVIQHETFAYNSFYL